MLPTAEAWSSPGRRVEARPQATFDLDEDRAEVGRCSGQILARTGLEDDVAVGIVRLLSSGPSGAVVEETSHPCAAFSAEP